MSSSNFLHKFRQEMLGFRGASLWTETCRLFNLSHTFSQSSFKVPPFFVSDFFYLLSFPPDFPCPALPPICHPTTILPPVLLPSSSFHPDCPLPAIVHRLHVCIKSLDFSAHSLTVNRKWLTWISIPLYELKLLSSIQLYWWKPSRW